uniref:Uncharacterized protein n=1 Tax=Arundo donax TaxID=35708 RepID=A0A0A9BLC8_ARUDO
MDAPASPWAPRRVELPHMHPPQLIGHHSFLHEICSHDYFLLFLVPGSSPVLQIRLVYSSFVQQLVPPCCLIFASLLMYPADLFLLDFVAAMPFLKTHASCFVHTTGSTKFSSLPS